MDCWIKGGIGGFLRVGFILGLLWISAEVSLAGERSDALLAEIRALDTTFQQVLSQLDQSARQSEEVSRDVQSLKSQGAAGVLNQIRLEGLLSRLREILLDRREMKKLERDLQIEREKKARLLYDCIGEEIELLLREAERLVRHGEGEQADRIHRAVLEKMQMREALRRPRSLHIDALPRIELPNLEGASPIEMKEMAVLLRNDAETLDRKRKEMEEERWLLREELKIKQTLARLQGFPRGIEKEPIDRQIQALDERQTLLNEAIGRYAERIETLFAASEQMLAKSKWEEERFK